LIIHLFKVLGPLKIVNLSEKSCLLHPVPLTVVQKTAISLFYQMKGKRKSKGAVNLLDEQQRVIQKIGKRLKELRLERGHSSYEIFAFENEIDRSQYGKYERGADLRISTLVKLLLALDISIEDFFSMGFKEK